MIRHLGIRFATRLGAVALLTLATVAPLHQAAAQDALGGAILGGAGGAIHVCVGGLRVSEANVIPHAHPHKVRVLEDEPYPTVELVRSEISTRDATNAHRPLRGV